MSEKKEKTSNTSETLDLNLIKSLRAETGAGVMDIKKALEESGNEVSKAKLILQKLGFEKADKKSGRETGDGLVFSYVHATGKTASLLVLNCETDFVAKTDDFQDLGREIAMQICAMSPKNVKELLSQAYIRDGSKTIEMLVKEVIAKTGENVKIGEFSRLSVN
ncbi:MAG: elongation factor Ts [bacterium]